MDVDRAKHLFDLGEICVHIASFLNPSQISCCEEAHFFPSKAAAAFLWHKAAKEILSKVPIWGPSGHAVIQQLLADGIEGKAFLRELGLLRRAIFPPKSWLPEVVEKNFCSAVVMPHKEQTSEMYHEETPRTPAEVAIPLTVGCYLGQPLAVGMQAKIDSNPVEIDSAFCIGVEVCACPRIGTSMSVLFAPFSGLCYMQYRGEACVLSTPALPAVTGNIGELRAWAVVSADGGIFFLRQLDEKHIDATGILPRNALPRWASEYFVCAHVWRAFLPSALDMSVFFSQATLPAELQAYVPVKHVDSTWQLIHS